MQHINLYQAQFKPKTIVLPAKQIGMLGILMIIILSVISLYASQKHSFQKATLNDQQQRYAKSQQQLATIQQQVASQTDHPLLDAELVDIQQQVTDNTTLLDYLMNHSFGNQTGFSSTLAGLSQQHINDVWLTEFALLDGGQFISLYGKALQSDFIPEYIDSLAKSEQFQGKEFSVFQLQQPSDNNNFYHFNLHTKSNVELP